MDEIDLVQQRNCPGTFDIELARRQRFFSWRWCTIGVGALVAETLQSIW